MAVITQPAKAAMHGPVLSNQGPFSADAESLTCGAGKCRVSGFDFLTWALEDGFDTPLGDMHCSSAATCRTRFLPKAVGQFVR